MKPQDIHDAVRKHYGALAASPAPGACCCDPGDCCGTSSDESREAAAALRESIAQFSLGCGDPVTIANLVPGETVLDLGSGGGLDCFLAAERVGDGGRIIGIDMTPEMVTRAEANRDHLGLANVEFRLGQIEALPVDEESVDVIMSNCVINLAPDKPAVFREAFRVLKPGGRLSVSDVVIEGKFDAQQRADMALWVDCVSGAIELGEYLDALRAAGFSDVHVVEKREVALPLAMQEGMPQLFSARILAVKSRDGVQG